MNIIMQDGISGFERNDIGGFGGPTFPSGELTPPIVEQPVENAQEITQQGMEVNTETKPPFFTEEGQVADVKSAEELAYKEKEFREEQATREAKLKKEYETGLTAEQRENLEVLEKLREKFPDAFVKRTDRDPNGYGSGLGIIAPKITNDKDRPYYHSLVEKTSDLEQALSREYGSDFFLALKEPFFRMERVLSPGVLWGADGIEICVGPLASAKPKSFYEFDKKTQVGIIKFLALLDEVGKAYKEEYKDEEENESKNEDIDDMLSRLGF